ncbi:gamma-glutamyltransferase family protein [Proteinivorax hydrogeniformans]|uniref:Gamma-glutamyltransferase family protein n=1 Tax=Proteinivorax hydrogeniformans TaxID=1826727 RepID=A0AAU8HR43_9FIRM
MYTNDAMHYPYSSQRTATFAKKGMVATSQPLASQAGLEILKKGGNAIDAAIATAACLTVVEPTSNGIGGDAFALVWVKDKLYGLNSSGPSPKSISIDAVKQKGYEEMPKFGFIPVTVPGVPAAWAALSKRFGKLSLTEVLKPAIDYAENGFPLSPVLSYYWQSAYKSYKKNLKGEEFKHWFETFAPDDKPLKAGDVWKSQAHADTLRSIATTDGDSFYKGDLADKIDSFSKKYGGFIRKEDLEDFEPQWVDPIKVNYRGYDVWEIPPNGQGLVALTALNIAKGFDFGQKDSADTYHKQIEALKLAFADGLEYITEENKMKISVKDMISDEYASIRKSLIGDEALQPQAGTPPKGGTVYLATADEEGNMVSFIQSNYMGFGSGLVVPGTGIALQNRGHNFSLDESHDNCLKPNKKTFHTIIPGFLSKGSTPIGPFGVMGGFMQPQGHMQVIMNSIDFGLNPQAALDAPRWQWMKDKVVFLEHSVPNHIAQQLASKGHQIQIAHNPGSFGRGQIIWRNPHTGVLIGGTESRTDGAIYAW